MDQAETFKKEREEKFGGEIRYLSYARYIGKAGGEKVENRGGILFVIGDTIHFEDFENRNALLSLLGQKKDYAKAEFSLELGEITLARDVRERGANDCIAARISEESVPHGPSGLAALFMKPVLQLIREDSPSLFFDLLDKKGFLNFLNEYVSRSE